MLDGDDDLELEDQGNEGHEEGLDEEEPAAPAEEGGEGSVVEGDEDEAAEPQAVLSQPAEKPLSRASRAVMQAKAEAKAAREKAEAIERELQSLRAERQQHSQRITEQERQERLALMTSEERMEFHLQELRQQQEQFQRQTLAQQQDQADRAAYLSKAASDPRFKKYEAEVERELPSVRANIPGATREFVLALLVGHKILTGDKSALTAAKKAGAARVAGQKTNPGGAASDQGGRKRGEKSLRERLENVTF